MQHWKESSRIGIPNATHFWLRYVSIFTPFKTCFKFFFSYFFLGGVSFIHLTPNPPVKMLCFFLKKLNLKTSSSMTLSLLVSSPQI